MPLIAARAIDLSDAFHRAQQGLDEVFLNLAQLEQLLLLGRRQVLGVGLIVDRIIEDFAEASADRGELRRGAFWQIFHRCLQALGNELPRAEDVSGVAELQGDLRQTELGQRAHLLHTGKTSEFDFKRSRDESFGLFRSECGDLGVDLHLHARDVGHCIHRQQLGGP